MSNEHAPGMVRSWADGMVPRGDKARRLILLVLVQSTGYGLFLSSGPVLFHRTVGLTVDQIGVGMSVAGLAGLLFTVPIGRLADRFGPRRLLIITYALLGGLFASYCLVRDFTAYVVVASLISILETSASPLRKALSYGVFEAEELVRVNAQMRSMTNISFLLGAALAAVALAVGSRSAFLAVVLLTGLGHLVCALIGMGLPRQAVRAAKKLAHAPRTGLRDLRFVSIALLSGLLEFYQPIITVALPLWIVDRTRAPASVAALLLVIDTVLVVVFQVAASRGAETVPGAAALLRRSGLLLALSCPVFALTQGASAAIAVPVLILGTVVLVLGELNQAAGSWGVSLHLPPAGRQGEYQGVFALGRGLQQSAGPFMVTFLAIGLGRTGWVVLGAALLAAGLLCPPLVRSAQAAAEDQQLEPVA